MGSARLHLNTPIGNIRYDKDGVRFFTLFNCVTLKCFRRLTLLNGTVKDEVYDYVVVTVSLGHLKKFHSRLFTPPLPPFKTKAIDIIGEGAGDFSK